MAIRTVVADPGHVPWMVHGAASLAAADMLSMYLTPLGNTAADERRLLRRLPDPIASRARRELQRRRIPESMPESTLARVATTAELTCVAAKRLGAPQSVKSTLAASRDRSFDRAVSRHLGRNHDAAHVAYGAALRTLETARHNEIATYVEHPVHHHRFAERVLQEEVQLQPAWAQTMQFHRPSPRRKARIEAEIALADRIIVLSRFTKQTFVDEGVTAEKIIVSSPGVDLDLFSPGRRAPDGTYRILFVGVFTQRKGLAYLIEGFRQARIPDGELLLVGAPWGRPPPVGDALGITTLNWVRNSELPDVYRAADVLVLPSIEEGFGRVVLEAMACGLPVIVTPNTGASDVVRDGVNGYEVPIRDSDAITDRLVHMYRNPRARDAMGSAARTTAEDFSWERYGSRLIEAITGGSGRLRA